MITWLLAAGGCAAPNGDSDPVGNNADSSAESELFAVSGSVVDLSGDAVVDIAVTVSTEFCIPDKTDSAGVFAVDNVSPGAKRLITYGDTSTHGKYASVAFAFEATTALTLSAPVLAPELVDPVAIDMNATDPQTLLSGDGVELTFEPGALELAPFASEDMYMLTVPVEGVLQLVPDGVELVDLVVLDPIRSTFDPPAALTLSSSAGLSPGTRVRFWSLDYQTGMMADVAGGSVGADGRPSTNPGEGIPEVTWIGLSLEQK